MRQLGAAFLALALVGLNPAGAPAREGPKLPRGFWVAGDLHAHSTYSHDSWGGPGDDNTGLDEAYTLGHSVDSQFLIASGRDLDFLAVTDHNDIRSQSDPGWNTHGVVGIPAYENSLRGHAQMLGARRLYDNGDESAAAVQALADSLVADGGVFQTNHPASEALDPDHLDWAYGYAVVPDTVEVWNISPLWQPPLPSGNSIDLAVAYWEGWLDRGARVAATGGSDNHWVSTTAVQGVGQPTTWVFVEELTAAGVLDGLRRGRTVVSHQPPAHAGPRVHLEADRHGDGTYEAIVGDEVPPKSAFRVRVEGAAGSLLRVFVDGGGLLLEVPVASPAFVHEFGVPAGTTWARAEIVEPDAAAVRQGACDPIVGGGTSYCRDRLGLLALTSAIFVGT